MSSEREPPSARVEREARPGWSRLLPLAALALALVLLRAAWQERGLLVTLHADHRHGLRPGDALRYRGIEVGEVEALELGDAGREVVVRVRLARTAQDLARAGTRFWIARPVLGVEGVRGLETALGARHLSVLPGPPGGARQTDFVALAEPPLFESEDPSALEIVLLASERGGLARGAPVLFRGLAIGQLVSVGLASDAAAVEVRARIHSEHAELVRVDSRFYRARAAALTLGLAGLELSVDSLQSLWLGGVSLATPTRPGARAATGQRFELAEEPEEEWLAWRPALPVGNGWIPSDAALPERVWAILRYEPRGWFARARSRSGWLVRAGGTLLGPADVLVAPEEAVPGSIYLELGGERVELGGEPAWRDGNLARRTVEGAEGDIDRERTRQLVTPEDLLVCGDPARAPMALAAGQLEREGELWRVSARVVLDERWHGALVLARGDGRWVGVLLVADGQGRIVAIPRS